MNPPECAKCKSTWPALFLQHCTAPSVNIAILSVYMNLDKKGFEGFKSEFPRN